MQEHFFVRIPGWPVALARVALGMFFLIASAKMMQAGTALPEKMAEFIVMFDGKSAGFYWPFIRDYAIPHNVLFGYMVVFGELAVGVALITGTCTRLASFFGLFMVVNFMLLKGAPVWTPTNHDTLYCVLLLLFMFSGAGRSLGFDYYLAKRFPFPLLW